jgi:hypothetical protein
MASAMKGSKRQSMSMAKVDKRRRTDCAEIAKAVKQATNLPAKVTHLLANVVPHALSVYSDERHDFQVKAVDMVENALGGVEAELRQASVDAKAKVANRDALKANRAQSVIDTANDLATKKGHAALKEAVIVQAELQHDDAKKRLAEVQKAAKAPERDYKNARTKAEGLQALREQQIQPLKDAAGTKKAIEDLVKGMKKFDVDESLLSTLPSVAAKAPAERGDFDRLTFENVEKVVLAKASEFAAGVQAAAPQMEHAVTQVDTAKNALIAAKDALKNAEEAFKAAQGEVSAAESSVKQAKKTNQSFEGEMKAAEADVGKTDARLLGFQMGPMKAFASLKATAAPQPPPPSPDAAPDVAAAA